MPFLKHGMGGDCDGQPDDERAEDEPSHGVSSAWIHERVRNSKPKGSARTLDAINKNADGIGRMPYKAMGGDHHQKRQVFESTLRDRHDRERKAELSKHSRLKKRG
jgi:hypothetical protein